MRLKNTFFRSMATAASVILMAAIWNIFAPTQFGGQASYVMVAGASMEPALERGDLVIIRESNTYLPDDVVTYEHPIVGPVIHRVIDREGDRFVLKGDNNDWIDSYKPVGSELIGKSWIHLPRAANILDQFRQPLPLGILSFIMAITIFGVFRKSSSSENEDSEKSLWGYEAFDKIKLQEISEGILLVLGLICLGGVVLAFSAFSKPNILITSSNIPYEHRGVFRYFGSTPPGIYENDILSTGDPIFHNVVDKFEVLFDYQLDAPNNQSLEGEYALDLVISEANGWTRSLVLQPVTAMTGSEVSMRETIQLEAIFEIIDRMERATDIQRSVYSITISPRILLNGRVADHHFQDKFNPELILDMSENQIYLNPSRLTSKDVDPFQPAKEGFIQYTQPVLNTISIFGIEISVLAARWIAALAIIISIAGFSLLFYIDYKSRQEGLAAQVQLDYGNIMIDVNENDAVRDGSTIIVVSMNDLVKIAEKNSRLILHEDLGETHHYSVHVNDETYTFTIIEETPHPDEELDDRDEDRDSSTITGKKK